MWSVDNIRTWLYVARKATVIIFSVVSLLLSVSVLLAPSVSASSHCESGGFLGLPTWYEYLPDLDDECGVQVHRTGGQVDIGATVGAVLLAVVEILLWVAGLVALGFIIYGGIRYTTSQGAPEKLQAARQTLLNGVIGLVIALLAVAIVNLTSGILF